MRPTDAHPGPALALWACAALAALLALSAAPPRVFPGLGPPAEGREKQSAGPASGPALEALHRAWEAAGDRLEQAVLFLQEPVADPQAVERIAAGLGWGEGVPPDEDRSLRLVEGIGGPYLELTWRLRGEAAARWVARYRELRRVLAAEGVWPRVHVELSGRAAAGPPLALAEAALDALGAGGREPWSEGPAASVAGYTPLLPPGPYTVNVQAAVRRSGDENRLWIGWPTVRSDY